MKRTIFSCLVILLFFQIGISKDKFLEGHYLDKEGNKITGLIEFRNLVWFKFKPSPNAKPIKIKPKHTLGFVINDEGNIREFDVIDNVPLHYTLYKPKTIADFVEVIQRGDMTLYKHRQFVPGYFNMDNLQGYVQPLGGNFIETLFIAKNDSDNLYKIPRNRRKNFKKMMLALVGENEVLKERIEANLIPNDIRAIEQVVLYYNKEQDS